MILTWMLYMLVVSVLLAVGARGAEEVLRVARLPVRFVWVAALVASVALAGLAPVRAGLAAPPTPAETSELAGIPVGSVPESVSPESASYPGAGALEVLRQALQWPLEGAATVVSGRASAVLGVAWLGLALALMTLGTGTFLRYRSARRHWPRGEIAGTGVRVAPGTGPAVLGLLHPEIVVPAWLLEKSGEEQRLVILHEREHLRARDPLTLTVGWVAAALAPWNPALWWMLSRLRLAVELDCDARVLRQGIGPQSYGAMLIDLAGRGSGVSLGVPALAGAPSTLEKRLLAMTTRFSKLAPVRSTAFGALGILAVIAACDAHLPTAAEVEEMDVASAEARVQELFRSAQQVMDSSGPAPGLLAPESAGARYFLDGVEVSAEEAHALPGDRLRKVEFTREGGEAGARIRIRSVAHPQEAPAQEATAAVERRRLVALQADTVLFNGLEEQDPVLILVDGVEVELREMRRLQPTDIARIEIVKGPAAAELYDDPKARGGVIMITTKKADGR